MTDEAFLRESFASPGVSEDFTAAVPVTGDGSRLEFCHRAGGRRARAAGPGGASGEASLAGQVLASVSLSRLNRTHLEAWFTDGPAGKPAP